MTKKIHPAASAFLAKKQEERTSLEGMVEAGPSLGDDALAINVTPGDISQAVRVAVERLAAHPHLYAFGDDIVEYNPDRKTLQVYPQHSDQQRLVVEQAGVFMQYSTTKQKWVPFLFTPGEVIRPVCHALLPRLRRLSSLEPLTEHRILSDGSWTYSSDRYEPQLERFLALATAPPPPKLPPPQEAHDALFGFLQSQYRFLDESHTRRCMAALAVTALVDFITGTTAPVFLVTAPKEGSGKTELTRMMLLLAGQSDVTTSYTPNRTEFLKILEPAIREGRRTLFFDNVIGHISHPEIERLVTSFGRAANIRELGKAVVTTTPFRSILWFTSNGATVTPDLRRRCYSIAIEHPNHGRPIPYAQIEKRMAEHERLFPELRLAVLSLMQHALSTVPVSKRTWQNLVRAFTGEAAPPLGRVSGEEDVLDIKSESGEDTASIEEMVASWPEGEWYSVAMLYNGLPEMNTECPHEELVRAVFELVESTPAPGARSLQGKRIALGKTLSKMAAGRFTLEGRRVVSCKGSGNRTMFSVKKVEE